jgi:3-dehydroquinate dehydratase-2
MQLKGTGMWTSAVPSAQKSSLMHLVIINGPNLNLLGTREPEKYGNTRFEDFLPQLQSAFPEISIDFYQSNVEGELINKLQEIGFTADAILLNAGGYTHTSVAIADAVAAISSPVLEIHLTNVYAREEFRRQNLLAPNCIGSITGLGLAGYTLGIRYFLSILTSKL